MAKKLLVIRIVLPGAATKTLGQPVNTKAKATLVECFRYAGVVNVLHDGEANVVPGLPEDTLVFDLFPPKAAFNNSLAWSRENAARMRSFGFEAEAVESGTEVRLFVVKDQGGGWACYNGIEGWHFTTVSNHAHEFIGEAAAHRVVEQHYAGQELQVIPRLTT